MKPNVVTNQNSLHESVSATIIQLIPTQPSSNMKPNAPNQITPNSAHIPTESNRVPYKTWQESFTPKVIQSSPTQTCNNVKSAIPHQIVSNPSHTLKPTTLNPKPYKFKTKNLHLKHSHGNQHKMYNKLNLSKINQHQQIPALATSINLKTTKAPADEHENNESQMERK